MSASATETQTGSSTRQEIFQQPALWPTTVERVQAAAERFNLKRQIGVGRILFTGAGTSAYAASAAAAASPQAFAVPTTDLLLDVERHLAGVTAVISLARSGQSPESAAVVELVRRLGPDIFQLAITCNPDSALTRSPIDHACDPGPPNQRSQPGDDQLFFQSRAGGSLLLRPGSHRRRCERSFGVRRRHLLPAIDRACQAAAGHGARPDGGAVLLAPARLGPGSAASRRWK